MRQFVSYSPRINAAFFQFKGARAVHSEADVYSRKVCIRVHNVKLFFSHNERVRKVMK